MNLEMRTLTEDIKQNLVKRIVAVSDPEKIIFFGSYAYGTQREDSDIDLIVLKKGVKSRLGEYVKIRKELKGFKFPFDIIIMSPEEYDFYSLNWKNSAAAEARERGIVLYG